MVTYHLENTYKVNISTQIPQQIKYHGKIMELKSLSKYQPTLQQKFINNHVIVTNLTKKVINLFKIVFFLVF